MPSSPDVDRRPRRNAQEPELPVPPVLGWSSDIRVQDSQSAPVPSNFRILQENNWRDFDRAFEYLQKDLICTGKHEGKCIDTRCESWDNMVECELHEPGVNCGNLPFRSLGAPIGLYKVSQQDYGVYSRSALQKHAFVHEYMGKVVRKVEMVSNNAYYVMLEDDLFLDGKDTGSLASFVNHSCNPNCCLQLWWKPVGNGRYEPRVGIFAIRDIEPGEPITIDYRMQSIVPFSIECHCGETNCRDYVDFNKVGRSKKRKANISRQMTEAHNWRDVQSNVLAQLSLLTNTNPEYWSSHLSILQRHSSMFQVLGDLSNTRQDIVTNVNNLLQINKFPPAENLEFSDAIKENGSNVSNAQCTSWEVTCKLFGIPFIGKGKSPKEAKKMSLFEAVKIFQAALSDVSKADDSMISELFPRPKGNFSEQTAYKKSLDDVLQTLWVVKKDYEAKRTGICAKRMDKNDIDKAFLEGEQAELNDLKRLLFTRVHDVISNPNQLFSLIGKDKFKYEDLTDAAAVLLERRGKAVEIGQSLRMKSIHKSMMALSNRMTGPFVVLVGPMVRYSSLPELCAKEDITTRQIMCPDMFRQKHGDEMTFESIVKNLQKNTVSRLTSIWAVRIHSVLYPVQTIVEFSTLLTVLERHFTELVSREKMLLLKRTVIGEAPARDLDTMVVVNSEQEDVPSSMVIAYQMYMTTAKYKEVLDSCRHVAAQIKSNGSAWPVLPSADVFDMKKSLRAWMSIVRSFSSPDHDSLGARKISSLVDEYQVCPGKPQGEDLVLAHFLRNLNRISMLEDVSMEELLKRPKKGLSPIARSSNGECFRMMELYLVILAELRTGKKNITVSSYCVLSGVPGIPMQPPHFDAWSWIVFVGAIPLNLPSEGQFKATLVPKDDIDYEKLWNCNEETEGCPKVVAEAYRAFLEKDPETLRKLMVEAVNTLDEAGFLVMMGNILHCGPGNQIQNGERRNVCFFVTGESPDHYDGQQQMFWDAIIESIHGPLCFWALLHVTEFELCYGVHFAAAYRETSLPVDWAQTNLKPQSKGDFLQSFLYCVRRLIDPEHHLEAHRVLTGDKVFAERRKRSFQQAEPAPVFGDKRYSQYHVRSTVVELFTMVTGDELCVNSTLSKFLQKQGLNMPAKGFAEYQRICNLRKVHKLVYDANKSFEYGLEMISRWVQDHGDDWQSYRVELAVEASRSTTAALKTAAEASQRALQLEAGGFAAGKSVVWTDETGNSHDAVITNVFQDGKIKICIPLKDTWYVVTKRTLTLK